MLHALSSTRPRPRGSARAPSGYTARGGSWYFGSQECRSAARGCVDCKKRLLAGVVEHFAPLRERRARYENDPELVDEIVAAGCARARASAARQGGRAAARSRESRASRPIRARRATNGGNRILARRRAKGRKRLSA